MTFSPTNEQFHKIRRITPFYEVYGNELTALTPPDRPFRRIIVGYGNLKSRMVGLWFCYKNFYNLPF